MSDLEAIDEAGLRRVVTAFYERVRADPMLGPLFDRAIPDWPEHLERLSAFWSSVMLTSGRYKGNPLATHLKHGSEITPAHFVRWLDLWNLTTAETAAPDVAARLQVKASRIADSLQLGLFYRLKGDPQ